MKNKRSVYEGRIIDMARILDYFSRGLFQLKWLFWTPTEKYAYLWDRTCSMQQNNLDKERKL
jgi:hypothetical protein